MLELNTSSEKITIDVTILNLFNNFPEETSSEVDIHSNAKLYISYIHSCEQTLREKKSIRCLHYSD